MFKRYAYSGQSVKANTFIGGVAATLSTPALLATRLQINEQRIKLFEIRGNDIRCCIVGEYQLPSSSFYESGNINFYDDKDGLCKNIGISSFYGLPKNPLRFNFPGVITQLGTQILGNTFGKTVFLMPNCTKIDAIQFSGSWNTTNANNKKILVISKCTNIGFNKSFNNVFNIGDTHKKYVTIYAPISEQTSNAGGVEGDLADHIAKGGTVVWVPNTSAPARITNLTIGAITTTTIALNFTAPSSVNTIEKYEVEIDGVWYQDINGPGDSITGLVSATKYKNITVKARDIYYNRTEEESNKIPEVETSAIVIDIVSDFKTRVLADGGTFENEAALRVFAETLVIGNTTLALAPSSFKAGKIYNLLPTIPNDATISRAGTKTRINKDGILENVPANTLSPDYSTGNGRIWVNPQTTLPAMNTNNFASGWTKRGIEIIGNTCISPEGTMNGNTFNETADVAGVHRMYKAVSVVTGLPYVISIFVQAKDHNWIFINLNVGFSGEYACFDVLNGVIGNTNTPTARIDNLPNSTWKRISIVAVAANTGNVYPTVLSSTNNQNVTALVGYVGTNAECFNIFGCNIIQADRIAPYIHSENVAKTVNADIVTITPPALTAKIIESLDNGAVNTVTTIPSSYQVPFGRYKSIAMTK